MSASELPRSVSGRGRAFTLVEMLLASALATVVALALWQLFSSGLRAMSYGTWYSGSTAE
ncbi:MAG: prepilin-type N-terminal cleavage/methylation domain-containing protein, partial [Candidatus Riflebacteria bacterium]|nr:prepilin-type N-terminal cleavage/methylation domain-containing protein [Candidatus Riflebacteria bacterium]